MAALQVVFPGELRVEGKELRLLSPELIVGVLIPSALLATMLAFTLLTHLWWPRALRRLADAVVSPFRQMLTLDELLEMQTQECEAMRVSSWRQSCLSVGSGVSLAIWVGVFGFCLAGGLYGVRLAAVVVQVILWTYSVLAVSMAPLRTAPFAVIVLWIVSAASELVKAYFVPTPQLRDPLFAPRLVYSIAICVLIYVAGTYPLKAYLPGSNVAKPGQPPTADKSCPEDAVNLWQWMTFSFFHPMLDLASTRTLNESDIWKLSPFFAHRNIFQKWQRHREAHPRQRLIWGLIQLNVLDLLIDFMLRLWSAVVAFVSTYALKRILDALATRDPEQRPVAFAFVCVHFIVNMSFAQFDIFQKWHSRRCYERSRGQIFCMLHDKALRRKDFSGVAQSSRQNTETPNTSKEEEDASMTHANVGKITNLMNGDAYAVAQRFWDMSDVFVTPVRLGIALSFLYSLLGWSAFLGLVVVALSYLPEWPMVKLELSFTRAYFEARDARMGASTETIQSIRFLKYMGWETVWATKVLRLREKELRLRIRQMVVSAVRATIWNWVPSAILVTCFWGYTALAGYPLTVSTAFVSISLFSNLQASLRLLPIQITEWLRAMVSVRRIEAYLAEEDVPDWVSTMTRPAPADVVPGQVVFENAVFSWPTTFGSSSQAATPMTSGTATPRLFRLGPIDLELPRDKLTLVVGPTGSGKSTLLSAMLGEIDCLSGHIRIDKSSVSYAAQHPWIEHYSIRDNIIFQSPFDPARYDAVLDACALRPDLEILKHGDRTQLGERGISLSGGQKARIALARAIYSNTKVVLLDDPLAACDMHTARTLVTEGLQGPLLKDRTVVMVTHHVSLCRDAAALILHLDHGAVEQARNDQVFEDVEDDEAVETVQEAMSGHHIEVSLNGSGAILGNAIEHDSPAKPVEDVAAPEKLLTDEERQEGRVSRQTYITYIRAASTFGWIILVTLAILQRSIGITAQWILKTWGEAYPHKSASVLLYNLLAIGGPTADFPSPADNVTPWVRLYFAITAASVLINLLATVTSNILEIRASRKLFGGLLHRIIRAPTRWFDQTPVGRIENRLVGDMATIDYSLRGSLDAAVRGVLTFVMSSGVIIFVVPSFAPFAVVIAWLYVRVAPPYIRAARDLRRLESVSRSPMFQNFSNLLYGITSIRAYAAEERYQNRFYESCDAFQTCDHHYWLASMWLMYRYDCLGSVVVLTTSMFALGAGVNEGLTAIMIVQAEIFASAMRDIVAVFAQLELDFNSIERVAEYLRVDQEAPAIIADKRPPAYWPSESGGLHVEGLCVRYAPHLPDVLKGLSFSVEPREKIGIVGRTGSGKTTLALSVLRMIEPREGRLILDGIDICSIGLEDLRTRITMVSQDVTLFAGTVRQNLDPLGRHSDDELWDVLQRCHLVMSHSPSAYDDADSTAESSTSEAVINGLEMMISEGGKSFSAGQRQLLALARALLRDSKVVVMDEATASIDQHTDDMIQETLRTSMSDVMVITIAHRLGTIIDYDRIIVLDQGNIVEFDSPKTLLSRTSGHFRRLCENSADWTALKRAVGL